MSHKIVFRYNQALSAIPQVSVFDKAQQSIGQAAVTYGTNTLLVTLTNIPDATRVRIDVQASGPNDTLQSTVTMGFLIGDGNGTGSVNASDISGVKARSGFSTDMSNFRFDMNLTGSINAADISAIKARSGRTLD